MVEKNSKASQNDGIEAQYDRVLLGITKASLATESFLSAASFQETTRVLTGASVAGKKDQLRGFEKTSLAGVLYLPGLGLHHEQRRAENEEVEVDAEEEARVTAIEAEQALSEALKSSDEDV